MIPTSPGITHLLNLYPDSGHSLRQLAHQLLYQPSPLSRLEREIIAARTSMFNSCEFCHSSHKAIAIAIATTKGLRGEGELTANEVEKLCTMPSLIFRGARLLHLDNICKFTQSNGNTFQGAISEALTGKYLTPHEVHDCVLITSAFCMYNRYVTSLNPTPATPSQYQESALRIAQSGYLQEKPPTTIHLVMRAYDELENRPYPAACFTKDMDAQKFMKKDKFPCTVQTLPLNP